MHKIFKYLKQKYWPRSANGQFSLLLSPWVVIMGVLVLIPLFIIFIYSLIQTGDSSVDKVRFSLIHFENFFKDTSLLKVFARSFLLAGCASFVSGIIGYPIAYVTAFSKNKFVKANLIIIITIPIWTNLLLRTLGLRIIFNLVASGMLGTFIAMVIGMVYVYVPFMILSIYNSLNKFDKTYYEASTDLGANRFKTFWKIVFPLSIPGVTAGFVMVFLLSATTLVIPEFLGESKFTMITNMLETFIFQTGDWMYASSISVIILVFTILFYYSVNKFSNKYQTKAKKRK